MYLLELQEAILFDNLDVSSSPSYKLERDIFYGVVGRIPAVRVLSFQIIV